MTTEYDFEDARDLVRYAMDEGYHSVEEIQRALQSARAVCGLSDAEYAELRSEFLTPVEAASEPSVSRSRLGEDEQRAIEGFIAAAEGAGNRIMAAHGRGALSGNPISLNLVRRHLREGP